MKNIATFMLVSALMLGFFTSCDSGVQHRTFRGIYADDPAGMEGLYNPERGFRLEVALDVTEKNYVWAPEEYPDITSYLIWKNSPNSMLPIAYHWFRPTSI